jgi:3-deoxy-D-arabino-heptulosonate 7-phosphate (DAHP) synthase
MSLSDWQKNGWLPEHQTSPEEIRELLAVVDRDLADARAEGLSADWRTAIAYNAGLQAATAALAASGYRATRDQHHYRVIQSLRETVGLDAPTVGTFDVFRKKRNAAGYERAGLISDTDARAMRDLAERLRDAVIRWLKKRHPTLL